MKKRIYRGWLATGFMLAFAACSNDANVVVGTTAVNGSVGGVVLDAAMNMMPLKDAAVVVIAGGATKRTTTDDQGIFSVPGVPAGSVVIHISAMNRFDIYLNRELVGSAGNFPITNPTLTVGPVAMVTNTGVFKIRLVDDAGGPVPGVKVTARAGGAYLDISNGSVTQVGVVEAGGTSDMAGLVTVSSLPDYNAIGPILSDVITVDVPPAMVQGSGEVYSFLGLENTYSVRRLISQTPTLVLAGPHTPFQVLSSSLDYIETGASFATPSLVKVSGPINVVFNQAVSAASVRALLYADNGQQAAVMPVAMVTANVLSLGFGGKMLDPGTRYNLDLHASGIIDQTREYNVLAPFFSPVVDYGAPISIVTARPDPAGGNDVIVTFSEPIGVGNGSVSAIGCVVYYEADLDGNSQVTSPGEWNPNGNSSLRCIPGDPHGGYYLRPDETSFAGVNTAAPTTGFTKNWRIQVKPMSAVCVGNYQCSVSGAMVHLQFSRNPDNNAVVRRTNGAMVPDIAFQLNCTNC